MTEHKVQMLIIFNYDKKFFINGVLQ